MISITELRALHARLGTLSLDDEDPSQIILLEGRNGPLGEIYGGSEMAEHVADGRAIVAAVNALAPLLRVVRAAREQRAALARHQSIPRDRDGTGDRLAAWEEYRRLSGELDAALGEVGE